MGSGVGRGWGLGRRQGEIGEEEGEKAKGKGRKAKGKGQIGRATESRAVPPGARRSRVALRTAKGHPFIPRKNDLSRSEGRHGGDPRYLPTPAAAAGRGRDLW